MKVTKGEAGKKAANVEYVRVECNYVGWGRQSKSIDMIDVMTGDLFVRLPAGKRARFSFGDSEMIYSGDHFTLHTFRNGKDIGIPVWNSDDLRIIYTEDANGVREFVDIHP